MLKNKTIRLSEFCSLMKVQPRQVRYVLEEGFVPDGVKRNPSTGHHRRFDPGQAFWLAMVLRLKESGVKTPLAALAANYATESVKTVAVGLNWDLQFRPTLGQFDTENEYYVDIGDMRFVRFVTSSCPSKQGLYEFDWHFSVRKGKWDSAEDVRPFVLIRLDLTQIARSLRSDSWKEDE